MSTKIKTSTGWKTVANKTVCFGNSPVGAVQAYYGASDPEEGNWLICDGRDTTGTAIELATVYPKLYRFLGNSNVLPDLRGEFLRGAGANSHADQGSGGTVGQHQDATELPVIWKFNRAIYANGKNSNYINSFENADSTKNISSGIEQSASDAGSDVRAGQPEKFMTRPTNTSVSWIICAR